MRAGAFALFFFIIVGLCILLILIVFLLLLLLGLAIAERAVKWFFYWCERSRADLERGDRTLELSVDPRVVNQRIHRTIEHVISLSDRQYVQLQNYGKGTAWRRFLEYVANASVDIKAFQAIHMSGERLGIPSTTHYLSAAVG